MIRFAALLAASLLASTAASAATVVTADRYLDVQTGRYVEHPAIFIGDDGRISSIADARTVRWGADVKHIDHERQDAAPGPDRHARPSRQPGRHRRLSRARIYRQLLGHDRGRQRPGDARRRLHHGAQRRLGQPQRRRPRRRRSATATSIGPRIVPAGYALGATGGHCDSTFLPPSLEKPKKEEGVGDGPEELRYQVRRQRKFGAEVIKVCATGGVFSRNTEPGQQQLTEAELRAIADEAHQWGVRVAAHAHGADGIKAAIRAGIDTIEHASLVDAEGIKLAVARKRPVWFSMDIYNTEYTQAEGKKNGVLEDNLRKDREIAQIQRDGFRAAHAAGVRMVFGSDAGVMPHGQIGRQFATMVTYGMTPLQAIQAATRNAAEALGRERDVGAIAVGRYGDLVAVTGDPLHECPPARKARCGGQGRRADPAGALIDHSDRDFPVEPPATAAVKAIDGIGRRKA